jgi:hypothetical protein
MRLVVLAFLGLITVVIVCSAREVGAASPPLSSPFTGGFVDVQAGAPGTFHPGINGPTAYAGTQNLSNNIYLLNANSNTISMNIIISSQTYYGVTFQAPIGTPLAVGDYDHPGFGGSQTQAGFVFSFGDSSEGQDPAAFQILDISFNGDGSLKSFAAQFELHAASTSQTVSATTPAVYGEVSYHSTVPFYAYQISQDVVEIPSGGLASSVNAYTVTNDGQSTLNMSGFGVAGANPNDFHVLQNGCGAPLPVGATCEVVIGYTPPSEFASSSATLTFYDQVSPTPPSGAPTGIGLGRIIDLYGFSFNGYYTYDAIGAVYTFGDAPGYGSIKSGLTAPVVGLQTTADFGGYWLASADGKVFPLGDAARYGDASSFHLNNPIVTIATTVDGSGYWLVATDGGIFSFGNAQFFGSTGAIHLNKPIVGMAPTPDGRGYWLVASDGGIFSFGDAQFYGSTGEITLNKPVVGMAPTPDGGGYWLVASDGGIFSFGDAQFYGSTGAIHLNKPVVGMASTPDGGGYWLVAADGGIFTFGNAPYLGSTLGPSFVGMTPLFYA